MSVTRATDVPHARLREPSDFSAGFVAIRRSRRRDIQRTSNSCRLAGRAREPCLHTSLGVMRKRSHPTCLPHPTHPTAPVPARTHADAPPSLASDPGELRRGSPKRPRRDGGSPRIGLSSARRGRRRPHALARPSLAASFQLSASRISNPEPRTRNLEPGTSNPEPNPAPENPAPENPAPENPAPQNPEP